jgi:hypothetical protein
MLCHTLNKYIATKGEEEGKEHERRVIREEWRCFAAILDRIFLVTYLIVIVTSLIILFPKWYCGKIWCGLMSCEHMAVWQCLYWITPFMGLTTVKPGKLTSWSSAWDLRCVILIGGSVLSNISYKTTTRTSVYVQHIICVSTDVIL